MSDIHVCGNAAKLVPEVIDALNGSGPKPDAVTVGGTRIYFNQPNQQLKKHEWEHVVQAAEFAPKWARWLPIRIKAWLGAPRFWEAYVKEHAERGYVHNKFEIAARAAEYK